MKSLRTALITVVMGALLTNTQAQSWLTNGLVAYYPFNGNANDASGHGNNGTVNGATLTSDRFGVFEKAFNFSGAQQQFIALPLLSALNGQSFASFSFWINANPTNAGTIIGHWGNNNGGVNLNEGFVIGALAGPKISISNNSGTGGSATANSLPNGWHHMVVVLNGTASANTNRLILYVDSIPVSVVYGIVNGNVGNATSTFIGRRNTDFNTFGDYFNGQLDDVRIYNNRALSANEVAQLYALESFCSPHRAQAIATLSGDGVAGAVMLDSGCGYTNAPSVRIEGGGGNGATAIATMTDGIVTGLVITNPGSSYTNAPRILIESPPFVPTVAIAVSKVKVTQQVRVNHNYVLEATLDLTTWTATGPAFTAEAESIVSEFDVDAVGRYFRLREVP